MQQYSNYKKRLYCLFFLCLPAGFSNAQFNGILSTGLNLSQIRLYSSGFDKIGVMGSAGTIMSIGKRTSCGAEISYNQKGTVFRDSLVRYKLRLNYIETGLFLNYMLRNKIQTSAGISYAKLQSYKEFYYDSTFSLLSENLITINDINISIGAGYFLSPHFKVSLAYMQSWTLLNTQYQFNDLFSLRCSYFIKPVFTRDEY